MANNYIAVTEGTGKNIGTTTITESAVVKDIQRFIPNNSAGTEIGTATNPIFVRSSVTAELFGMNL